MHLGGLGALSADVVDDRLVVSDLTADDPRVLRGLLEDSVRLLTPGVDRGVPEDVLANLPGVLKRGIRVSPFKCCFEQGVPFDLRSSETSLDDIVDGGDHLSRERKVPLKLERLGEKP